MHTINSLVRHSLLVLGAGTVLFLVCLFSLDHYVFLAFKLPEFQSLRYWAREITNIGLSGHYFLLALMGLILSRFVFPRMDYFKNKMALVQKTFEWSAFLFWNLFWIGLSINLVKATVGRQRPHVNANFNNLNFKHFTFEEHYFSLPSGHTQVLFTVATIAMLLHPRYKVLFFMLAFVFSLTRAMIEQHWLSDLVAGALLGYLGVLWMYFYFPPKQRPISSP